MRILLISLGCDKNLVDSEFMLGSLLDEGYELTDMKQKRKLLLLIHAVLLTTLRWKVLKLYLRWLNIKRPVH